MLALSQALTCKHPEDARDQHQTSAQDETASKVAPVDHGESRQAKSAENRGNSNDQVTPSKNISRFPLIFAGSANFRFLVRGSVHDPWVDHVKLTFLAHV
jgi:hypothetical protein